LAVDWSTNLFSTGLGKKASTCKSYSRAGELKMIKTVQFKKNPKSYFFVVFEHRDFTRVASEKYQYLGIDPMDFGPSTCFGNIITFYLDLQNTKS
jgi:hypothetical protein